MKEILKNLPVDQGHEKSNMKVGFITYNNTVHFYNIKGSLAQPQMMVVGDLQEMFMPLLDGFLCDVEESAAVIDSLMEQIPAMFADTRDTEVVLLPAIQAGLEALKVYIIFSNYFTTWYKFSFLLAQILKRWFYKGFSKLLILNLELKFEKNIKKI